jgi:ABC-type multidrug transport system ATPase subunit
MVLPGEMCAIMGSSGAGKTTLLNILSQRKRASDYSGRIYYNGVLGVMPPFGYVTQEDVHMGVLTVRESLTFAANLRLSEAWSAQEKAKRVQRVLALLILQHVANNTVGEALSHGISGGELKRLSIGVELLHFPGLMFLDEPTTGLDSSTSMEVLSALRNLANQHRTIVMTLHQPSQDIFQLFDRVLIMAEARVVYFGGVQNCADFYTQSPYKFAFPTTMDPAEFMIAVAGSRLQAADGRVVSAGELAAHYRTTPSCNALRESVRHLIATYAQNTASTPHPSKDPAIAVENAPHLSFRYQLQILLERRILVTRRRWLFFAWKLLR